jgi:endonuclease YncB( thermonuclease family)
MRGTVAMAERSALLNRLSACTLEGTRPFKLDGLDTMAKIVSVTDGDTVKCAFDLMNTGFWIFDVRLEGIDTPELRGKTPEERAHAQAAKKYLTELALNKIVRLTIKSKDKYGRLIGSFELDGKNIAERMIAGGFARKYDGGTRDPWVYKDE